MGDEINPSDKARQYRWRPAVSPYRPPGIARVRARKSLPGQMLLPGIESTEPSSPTGERAVTRAPPSDSVQAHDGGREAPPKPGLACPNCGATEFDEDGDCIHCWEPGVVPTDTRPKAREG